MSSFRHLLSIRELDLSSARLLLEQANEFFALNRQSIKKAQTLRGKTVLNLFYENSTRTRTSFEIAGKRLGADVINISVASSSAQKGETLRDTVSTLDAMQPDVVVLRHAASGAAHFISRHVKAAVVNAGDGMHEHPTQALLDCFTIKQHISEFSGKKIAICGDIRHSRVARSGGLLLSRLGADVRFAAPRTMWPVLHQMSSGKEQFVLEGAEQPIPIYDRLEPAIEDADVVMMLRIQQERLGAALFPTTREYSKLWGLSSGRLKLAKPGALVMHPGPMNRGVEINEDVVESEQAVVLDQVESGVAVRMAVLCRAAEIGPEANAN